LVSRHFSPWIAPTFHHIFLICRYLLRKMLQMGLFCCSSWSNNRPFAIILHLWIPHEKCLALLEVLFLIFVLVHTPFNWNHLLISILCCSSFVHKIPWFSIGHIYFVNFLVKLAGMIQIDCMLHWNMLFKLVFMSYSTFNFHEPCIWSPPMFFHTCWCW
jgi:hypothetical protein